MSFLCTGTRVMYNYSPPVIVFLMCILLRLILPCSADNCIHYIA